MDVLAEIEGLKMAVSDMGKQIAQLMIMVQDICDRLPPVQENLQQPGKSPEMAAALAKIFELEESVMKESKHIGFEDLFGTEEPKIHGWDKESDNRTSRIYSRNGSTLFGNNTHANTTLSSPNNNSSFTTKTIRKAKPTKTTTQINRPKNQRRVFSRLPAPLSSVYEELLVAGFLKQLHPTPPPQNPLPTYNSNLFCTFHQGPGHATERCQRLRHEIQDLIDNGTISFLPQNPSTMTKLLSGNQQNSASITSTSKYPQQHHLQPPISTTALNPWENIDETSVWVNKEG